MQCLRGALIVLEGCDCSGKTTQSNNLVTALNNQNVSALRMAFPNRNTNTGKVIDSYLKAQTDTSDQAIHLLFSANRWEAVPQIKQTLKLGTTIIVDRYSYSGVAYSFAKGGSLDIEWYKAPERGLPKPDLVLYLDLDFEVMKRRKGFGDERYESTPFQKAVTKVFHDLRDDNWKIINADKTESDLTKVLLEEVLGTIKRVGRKELSEMW